MKNLIIAVCISLISSLFLIASATQAVLAKPLTENIVDLQQDGVIYKPGEATQTIEIPYPSSARRNKVEGYIEVLFDLDTQGDATNLRYTRISGTDIFETLIKINLDDLEFEPATLNGTPIIQRNLQRTFTFTLTKLTNKFPEPLMRKNFAKVYLLMRKLLKEDSYEELGELLDMMEKATITRFVENRQLSIVRFTYLDKTGGNIHDKIHALERALKDSPRTEKTKILQNKIKVSLFKLYVQNKQYRRAFSQYFDLSNSEFSESVIDKLGPQLEVVKAQLSSGEPLATTIKVDDTKLLNHGLSRRMFKVEADQAIGFTELRCDTFNVQMTYSKNTLYQLPFDWDSCRLAVQAPKGSLVTITEAAIYDPI